MVVAAAIPAIAAAQTVTITPRKVTYTRRKPIMDYKKTFEISYPKVKASPPVLARKIERSIDPVNVLGINIREEMGEIQWLSEADFEVKYNKKGVLVVDVWMEGSGAYPSGTTKRVVVDLATGSRITPALAFSDRPGLLRRLEAERAKEMTASIAELKADPENKDLDSESLFKESLKFHKVSLDQFSVDDDGVTFYHEYAFPHVVQALQPLGEFRFTWQEIGPYIRKGGLLSRIAR